MAFVFLWELRQVLHKHILSLSHTHTHTHRKSGRLAPRWGVAGGARLKRMKRRGAHDAPPPPPPPPPVFRKERVWGGFGYAGLQVGTVFVYACICVHVRVCVCACICARAER
jgi:hypothetical protein